MTLRPLLSIHIHPIAKCNLRPLLSIHIHPIAKCNPIKPRVVYLVSHKFLQRFSLPGNCHNVCSHTGVLQTFLAIPYTDHLRIIEITRTHSPWINEFLLFMPLPSSHLDKAGSRVSFVDMLTGTVKPVYNNHLMGYFSAFWSSSKRPRAT